MRDFVGGLLHLGFELHEHCGCTQAEEDLVARAAQVDGNWELRMNDLIRESLGRFRTLIDPGVIIDAALSICDEAEYYRDGGHDYEQACRTIYVAAQRCGHERLWLATPKDSLGRKSLPAIETAAAELLAGHANA